MSPLDVPIIEAAIGARLSVDVAGLDERLTTALVGFVRSRYVAAQMPMVLETARENVYQHLYTGNALTVRYLHQGTVYGFSSEIIKYILSPFPLLFLTYPGRVETHELRKHRRLACLIPATLHLAKVELSTIITDLSLSGCGARLSVMPKYRPAVDIDDELVLDCPIFGQGGLSRLSCTVKRIMNTDRIMELGLKFQGIPPETKKSLMTYISNAASLIQD